MHRIVLSTAGALTFALAVGPIGCAHASPTPPSRIAADSDWRDLFNGRDLTGWTPKIAGLPLGEDPLRTFRVRDGAITVTYEDYTPPFADRFGHLVFGEPLGDYHLRLEYRFTGDQVPGAPEWALRNSGAMLHSQDPRTMARTQDFPISIEVQFLGGLSDGRPRPTGNLCSPGTEADANGAPVRGHCLNSTSRTFDGDQWVPLEALVTGDAMRIVVAGDTVLRLTRLRVGGGNVSGHDPAAKVDGTPLTRGWISLQSEGHPVQFRRVQVRPLRSPRGDDLHAQASAAP